MTPVTLLHEKAASRPEAPGQRLGRATTLVELLVAVAIIAIVLALSLPALSGARQAATAARCHINLRSAYQAVTLYTADYDDSFPMFARRRVLDAFENGGVRLAYFYQSIHWPMVVRPYLSDRPLDEAQVCPGGPLYEATFGSGMYVEYMAQYPPTSTLPSDYWMSYTMFTAPEMWRPDGDVFDESRLRPVRVAEVTHPSGKGAMVEPRAYHLSRSRFSAPSLIAEERRQGPYTIAFVDGRIEARRLDALVPGVTGNGSLAKYAMAPVLSTVDGARGTDLR